MNDLNIVKIYGFFFTDKDAEQVKESFKEWAEENDLFFNGGIMDHED